MAICIPVSIVAAAVAFFYGKSMRHAWAPALITFVLVMLGGLVYAGIGQIIAVALSALVIFIFFTLPEQRRIAQEEARHAKDMPHLFNEEDI